MIMVEKINIYIEIADFNLHEQVIGVLSEDWASSWNVINAEKNRAYPEDTHIAVIDKASIKKHLGPQTMVIFLGESESEKDYFSVIEKPEPDAIYRAIKRCWTYKEITRQNAQSLYSTEKGQESLENIAHSLSIKVHQLIRQSEMRIALVDQMPVGVIGIDDEDSIVLANPKAIELLGLEEYPLWGIQMSMVFTEDVCDFIKSNDDHDIMIDCYDQKVVIRKTNFILDDKFAGRILMLWERGDPEQREGIKLEKRN
jgi:PAS domain-containing protein